MDERDASVRIAAFAFLREKVRMYGDLLPRVELARGFNYDGQRVPLLGPQGIFKPALLPDVPLSITTVPEVEGRQRPYEDEVGSDGLLAYRYRGTDPRHHDNVALRRAYERQAPLVYFHGIAPGWYAAVFPVYVVADDQRSLTFTIQADEPAMMSPGSGRGESDLARRRYVTRVMQQRIHQARFRATVLLAYRVRCTICRLHDHPELLDAAHILPDGHPRGEPIVPNGLALCKLHHAAFDANLMGVRPDHVIEVKRRLLEEIDGPMLLHGLQGFDGQTITVPRRTELRPNREFLEERYELFRAAS